MRIIKPRSFLLLPTRLMIALCGLPALFDTSRGASVLTVFYDITFSSPLHIVGSRPTTSAGPDTPTSIVFGNPEVVAAFGSLTDQPVLLNTAGNSRAYYYDQFRLNLGFNQPTYHLSFDLYTEGLIDSRNRFTVLFDSQPINWLSFNNNGNLYPPGWGGPAIPFADQVPLHVDVSFDRLENRVVTLIDGVLVSNVPIVFSGTPGDPQSIRFSLGAMLLNDANDPRTSVAIDNIRVTNGFVVPEPTVAAKFVLGAALAFSIRRRRLSRGG